jgi:short-subunit dehydrogenase
LYSGKWAIVTGATSAIGSAFCTKLASYGMNVMLIGRNKDKLHQLAHLLNEQTKGGIKTRILVHDFTNEDVTAATTFHNTLQNKLEKYSQHHGIGMLIHCTNFRNDTPTLVHEMQGSDVQRLLEDNIDSTVALIRTVLPFLIEKRFGAMITVSSHACCHPAPLFSLYTATNAYRSDMMKNLFHECKQRYNVDCISVTPELMSSNLPRKVPSTTIVKSPNAERVVTNTFCMLGYEEEAFPFRGHAQSTWIPEWIWVNPWDRFLYKMKNSRAEILRKKFSDDH